MSALAAAVYESELELGARWAAGPRGALRLEDGRAVRVVFPGVAGGAQGPDFRGAMIDAGGDLLRGDVELHLRASGWRAHGHHTDDAYGGVVLHVVGVNDTGALSTLHSSGRAIPVLVLPALQGKFPPPFTPPCALRVAQGLAPGDVLRRLGQRRLRMKAARVAPIVDGQGAGQALYGAALEILGGPANREPFAALARRLPLAALLERAEGAPVGRGFAVVAELKGAAAALAVRRAGLRPMAAPGKRLEIAGALFARWWPGIEGGWPAVLTPSAPIVKPLPAGMGRASAIELAVNAILPVALAGRIWPEAELLAAWEQLPSPGTYGRIRRLEGWVGAAAAAKPFASAGALQGGLLLHAEWCTRGGCGRCPLSERIHASRLAIHGSG